MSQKQNTKDNKSSYVTERHSMYNALRLAWRDYYNLSKEQIPDKKIISGHKRVIRRLQDRLPLAIGVVPFMMPLQQMS